MTVLSNEQIMERNLVLDGPQWVESLQAHGVDLTVKYVEQFTGYGEVSRSGKRLPTTEKLHLSHLYTDLLDPNDQSVWGKFLPQGCYLVQFNETINLPNDVMAYLKPLSTLLRCGVSLQTAVWDAGYHGKGQSLLVVHNPFGFMLETNARIAQMVFHKLDQPTTDSYDGSYQHEGIELTVVD